MKARILFYCVAIAVLLATLAAIPGHATERRDPPLMQDGTQPSGSGRSDSTKLAQSHMHTKKPSKAKHTPSQGVSPKGNAAKKSASASNQISK
jgi:hypothetical protein